MLANRKMKDSGIEWIGEIPEDWSISKVKHCFTRKNSKAKQDAPVVLSLARSGVKVRDISNNEGQLAESYYDYNPVQVGDLLLNPMDLYSGANCSYSNVEGVISPAYINLKKKENVSNPKFYDYYFKVQYWMMVLFSFGKGVSFDNRWTLGQETLMNFPLAYPSLQEQQKIADFLDEKCKHIDAVLEKTRASIEEYKQLKQSVITQAVTKGIRPNRPMKDSGIEWIGQIPEDWKINTVFQMFTQVKNKNEGLIEQNLLSLSYGKLKRKSIDTVGGLLPENFDGYNIIEKDDIVLRLTDLQNDHKSLRVGLANERGIITSAYVTIRNRTSNVPQYLYYYLHSFDIAKGFYGMGAGVRQGLNWDGLKWLKITIPSKDEQQEVIAYLDEKCSKIDKLITKKEQLIEELETFKKSLIYEYVTGKKEVI